MTDHKELPPDIAEAEAELRPVYDAAKRKAPVHLRSRVLAAVKAAEAQEPKVPEPSLGFAREPTISATTGPARKAKPFAIAAAVLVTIGGLVRTGDHLLELRRVPVDEAVHAGHLAYGDDAVRALEDIKSSADKARHSFYESLPLSVIVAVPSLAEGGIAAPACEAQIVVRLLPDEAEPASSPGSLGFVLPDYLRVDLLEAASGAKSLRLAHKIEAFTYQFRMASDSPETCGVEKVFTVQMDLSKVQLSAGPVELVTDFTGTDQLSVEVTPLESEGLPINTP